MTNCQSVVTYEYRPQLCRSEFTCQKPRGHSGPHFCATGGLSAGGLAWPDIGPYVIPDRPGDVRDQA